MFEIEFSKTTEKQLHKLEKEVQRRIIKALERCRINPYPHVKKLVGCPYFRLRVQDYRCILDIRKNKMIIFVIEVGHWKNVYK
jgi:mRNA interferase RelE/StbE